MGYEATAGSELPYYIFNNSYRQAAVAGYANLEAVGSYRENYNIPQGIREETLSELIRRHLTRSGLPVEVSKGEWGNGQHEWNFHYGDALTMPTITPFSSNVSKESPRVWV
jgi:glutamine synthetase